MSRIPQKYRTDSAPRLRFFLSFQSGPVERKRFLRQTLVNPVSFKTRINTGDLRCTFTLTDSLQ
jgi:hypothetical protein